MALAQQVPHPTNGPAVATPNNISVFKSTDGSQVGDSTVSLNVGVSTAALTAAGAGLAIQANGANNAAAIWAMFGNQTNYDAISAAITENPGTTITNTNALAGYVLNNQASALTSKNAVALFGAGISGVAGAITWGLNPVLTDDTSTSGSGVGGARGLQNEFDFNLRHTDTTLYGLVFNGSSTSQPTNAVAFLINKLGTGITWTGGYKTSDGAIGAGGTGVYLGATATSGANVGGQQLAWNWFDAGAVERTYSIAPDTSGQLTFGSSLASTAAIFNLLGTVVVGNNLTVAHAINASGNLGLASSTGVLINAHTALFADAGTSLTLGSDASFANITIGNGTAAALINGGLQIGTPVGGNKGLGTLNVAGTIWTSGTQGVTCNAAPTVNWRSVNGITTVC